MDRLHGMHSLQSLSGNTYMSQLQAIEDVLQADM